ncbi:MAG: c-type cytochrome [Halioglobus sp.]
MKSLKLREYTIITMVVASAAWGGTAVSASERLDDGKRVYEEVCATCHDSGADGAPRRGEAGDWSGRSHLWEAVLLEHVDKGYLGMPAQGGSGGLSEYDVGAASEYMLTESHPEEMPE